MNRNRNQINLKEHELSHYALRFLESLKLLHKKIIFKKYHCFWPKIIFKRQFFNAFCCHAWTEQDRFVPRLFPRVLCRKNQFASILLMKINAFLRTQGRWKIRLPQSLKTLRGKFFPKARPFQKRGTFYTESMQAAFLNYLIKSQTNILAW